MNIKETAKENMVRFDKATIADSKKMEALCLKMRNAFYAYKEHKDAWENLSQDMKARGTWKVYCAVYEYHEHHDANDVLA